MPIAVKCPCGKTLNVRDDLAGKAIKCPGCQQVVRVPAGTSAPAAARPAAAPTRPAAAPVRPAAAPVRPAAAPVRPAAAPAAGVTAPAKAILSPSASAASMDSLFAEAGFEVKTGQFCPSCNELLKPGAVLCTKCGYHLETGSTLQGHLSELVAHDSAEGALKRAEISMKRAKDLDDKLQSAGMPPWMMAMGLFILSSCTAVAVAAVNMSRRSKDDPTTFNAVATMFLLAGIAFAAVCIGSYCLVIARGFKVSNKQGMLSLIPLSGFFYTFTQFKTIGKPFLVFLITLGAAIGLFILANMSNSGQL